MERPDKVSRAVTIFGGASAREGSAEFTQAERLGTALAKRGLAVCNGGYGGTMLAAARGARQAGGVTLGVTLKGQSASGANAWIQREIACEDLLQRIMKLLELGDAYVVLPGGTGTLAETSLMLELMNKGLLPLKPVVLLGPFWLPLLEVLRGERILCGDRPHAQTKGVSLMGEMACTNSPEAAAEFLDANVPA